jgi:Tfp pilus assembly PilM family ATPase
LKLAFLAQGLAPLIGVDVSSSAVKMLELADGGKGMRRV